MSEADLTIGDPEDVTEVAPDLEDDLAPTVDPPGHVSESMVYGLLSSAGVLAAQIAPDYLEPQFTDDELAGLVPPMCRIINKRPAIAAAVHRGDEVQVAAYLAGYVGRQAANLRSARHADDQRETRDAEGRARTDARGPAGPDDGHRVDHAAPGLGVHPTTAR